jgi:hypothetical protein
MSDWQSAARASLLRQRTAEGAWGYRAGTAPQAEPTAWAGLALLGDDASVRAAAWLAKLQAPDGGVPICATSPQPKWPTAPALLLFCAVGAREPRRRALEYLLATEGRTSPRSPADPVQLDGSIVGWPWTAGAHSWVEPTALAVLALGRAGAGDHARARDGRRLLLDRAVPSGGWNYGNKIVLDMPLRPQPAPTGLALLALSVMGTLKGFPNPPAMGSGERSSPAPDASAGTEGGAAVAAACEYLEGALPRVRAGLSLGWGLLGLSAWRRRPAAADGWLAEAYERYARQDAGSVEIAHLLLARADALPGAGG